jgi:hypothetical protein
LNPELRQFFLDEIKDGRREWRVCFSSPLRFNAFSSRLSATKRSFLCKKQRPKSQPCSTIYVVFPLGWNCGEVHRIAGTSIFISR